MLSIVEELQAIEREASCGNLLSSTNFYAAGHNLCNMMKA